MQNARNILPHVQNAPRKMTEVHIISGPTCSGKTARAIELALEIGAEIISCDSVQVYRGMDIGSAKATAQERKLVRHHLIDVADVSENFDVSKYVELSKAAMKDILGRGKKVVVTGGSGFYLKAWFAPVADSLSIGDDIRKATAQIEAEGGAPALAEALRKADPFAGEFVDMNNPRRTKNALERCMASGKSVRQLLDEFSKLPCPMGELKRSVEFLDCGDDGLKARIEKRTESMIAEGLIEETKALIEKGIAANPSASAAIGYRETIQWINEGRTDTGELAELISADTFALVKKQRKFLKSIKALCGGL